MLSDAYVISLAGARLHRRGNGFAHVVVRRERLHLSADGR